MNRPLLLKTRTAAVESIVEALSRMETLAASSAEPEILESDVRSVLRAAFARFETITV